MLIGKDGDALVVRHSHEIIRIEPWGDDSVRVRAAQMSLPTSDVGALDTPPHLSVPVELTADAEQGRLVVGEMTVEVAMPTNDAIRLPQLTFRRTSTGEVLLEEQREHFWWPGARGYVGNRAGSPEITQQFAAYPGEKLFGMGQRTHGRLDHKGLALDLVQRNAEVSVPFVLSNRGYGFLWNNPAIGRVEFADNVTRWSARQSRGLDYWITTGADPAAIVSHYADATGHSPRLPSWASGFWQSKLRYRTQEELLEVAREHRRRGLPLSVIVADFFSWTAMGDYRFDPAEWPDPAAMVAELADLGVQLMVSIWPTVSPLSENYAQLRDEGLLVGADQGVEFQQTIQDKGMPAPMPVAFYDPTNPRTREVIWDIVRRNYYDLGVRVWWLDACEPELNPGHPANMVLAAGPGSEVAGIYPRDNARMFAEGMASADLENSETVLLCRSAWAGQQRYGAAVWSGDIPATWLSLQQQVRAGLSIGVAGIPWWTSDIGGFHGGDLTDPAYRELMVRWFQFGVFCPLFRLHGDREPRTPTGWQMTGGPNEVWHLGDEAYEIVRRIMLLRERLRSYLHVQLDRAAETGLPAMRPLFFDYPDDPSAWAVDDQFMLGPDVLVAPILEPGQREREVYVPQGDWVDAWTSLPCLPGRHVVVAPLNTIPVFVRSRSVVQQAFSEG